MTVAEVLERYELAWRTTRSYIGEDSQAGIYMGEQYLAAMLAFGALGDDFWGVAREVARTALKTKAKPTPGDSAHFRSYSHDAPIPTISYSQVVFDDSYLGAVGDIQPAERVHLETISAITSNLKPGGTYPYVVRATGEFLVWMEPIAPSDIMTGRTAASLGNYTHPLLAFPGLEVVCAGEATFGFADTAYGGTIINNRSGHYRPGEIHLTAASELIREGLGGEVVTIQYFGGSAQWSTG